VQFRVYFIAIALLSFLVVVAPDFGALAQSDLSSRIEADINALKDKGADPRDRRDAASALGIIGPAAAPAIPALVEALKDNGADPSVRQSAAFALGNIGPAAAPAIPALVEALKDKGEDWEVRRDAVSALGKIGPAAAPAIPALVDALKDKGEDPSVRRSVASVLGNIGPAAAPAIPALVDALKDKGADPSGRQSAALALGNTGAAAAPAIPALVDALKDKGEDLSVRQSAAFALGDIGPAAAPAIPALVEALKDKGADPSVRKSAALALEMIAVSLQDAGAIGALAILRTAQEAFKDEADLDVGESRDAVRRSVEYLGLLSQEEFKKDVVGWIKAHPYTTSIIAAVPIWLSCCLVIFWFSPATILTINDFLRPLDVKLPDKLGGIKVSLRHLLLVGALNYRPRVLDAWVSHHVGKVRENFARKRTVEERAVHIPVPVYLDKESVSELTGRRLRDIFGTGTGRLLIWGEGGAGKTSIACRIARWATADAPEERPAPHRMLPVLIERELDFDVAAGRDAFSETVRGDLGTLVGAQVSDDLVAALLKRRRILVIVDHLSEMTEKTRQRVRPDVPDFPAAALIVTSRLEERLGDVPKSLLEPLRVTGDYLFEFMGAYLRARGVRELFPDREFGPAGACISELVGERAVTVLLVKLYLDRLITAKQKQGDVDQDMPSSIPSLMLQYLNDIGNAVPEDIRRDARALHRDAKIVAWACLEERFRPVPARIETVELMLATIDPLEIRERLLYLERRLRSIETVEPERDRVRFLLDPVAEYLAGLHMIEHHRADADRWRSFLDQVDAIPGGLEVVRGFLLAVRDCCLIMEEDLQIPGFVSNELAERAGLDLERLRQAGLRERIARYTAQLKAPDPDERRLAAEALRNIGSAAESAIGPLAEALADVDPTVRETAVLALGRIWPTTGEVVPALTKALEDSDPRVTVTAALQLADIGPAAASAVPALVELLSDAETNVRATAALALGEIGPAAAPAMPALTKALDDEDSQVRTYAAGSLRAIGRMTPVDYPAA